MNKTELKAFAREVARSIKTPGDLNDFSRMLKKITVEAALNAKLDEHLGNPQAPESRHHEQSQWLHP